MRERVIGASVALAMGLVLAFSPLFGHGQIGGVPLNAVWITVAALTAFWLAPRLRGASPRRMLGIAIKMTIVVVFVSALLSGFWMGLITSSPGRATSGDELNPVSASVGLTLIGLLLFGWIGVLLGIPIAGAWAAIVRALLARDIPER